jgi:hypothetical protein
MAEGRTISPAKNMVAHFSLRRHYPVQVPRVSSQPFGTPKVGQMYLILF